MQKKIKSQLIEEKLVMKTIESDLYKFAFLPDWPTCLSDLEIKAIKENWKFTVPDISKKNQENPILQNYIEHTFARLATLYKDCDERTCKKWISIIDNKKACINTGLYTPEYNEIFMCFTKHKIPDRQDWVLDSFVEESDPKLFDFPSLPKRAKYITNIEDLIFDTSLELRVSAAHILRDEENLKRIPEEIKTKPNLLLLFNGAIEISKKRINLNYKTAVPQFFEGKIQLLIPICLQDISKTDLVLVVSRINDVYIGHTCLTLDMAYNNARLLTKPEAEWLAR